MHRKAKFMTRTGGVPFRVFFMAQNQPEKCGRVTLSIQR